MASLQRQALLTSFLRSLTWAGIVRFATVAVALALMFTAYSNIQSAPLKKQADLGVDGSGVAVKTPATLVNGDMADSELNSAFGKPESYPTCAEALSHQQSLQPFMLGKYEVITNINAADLVIGAPLPYSAV
jgi:hypothetical protein